MSTPQLPETNGNSKTTLDIAKDVLSYFKETAFFNEIKKKIEQECDIKTEHDDCWPADDIKRAWEKTKTITSDDRRHQALAIMMQLVKGWVYDECKTKAQSDLEQSLGQMNLNDTPQQMEGEGENTRCNMEEDPADTSSQGNAEPAGAVEQHYGGGSSASKPSQIGRDANKDKREEREGPNKSNSPTSYIRIPLSVLFGDESTSREDEVSDFTPPFKLIDRVPELAEISKKNSYVVLYNNQTKNPAWVYEILNRNILANNYEKRRSVFKEDDSINVKFRTPESKKKYGKELDQGHHAAAAKHRWSEGAYNDTYVLTNMSPQHRELNRGIWKSLEDRCRKKALKTNEICNVHVYTGPLYSPRNDDPEHVKYKIIGQKAVPTHFFKVVIVEKEDGTVLELKCYKIPNEPPSSDLSTYQVPIDDIERDSGLIFRESGLNLREMKRTVTLTGVDPSGNLTHAEITVTVSTDS